MKRYICFDLGSEGDIDYAETLDTLTEAKAYQYYFEIELDKKDSKPAKCLAKVKL